MLDIVFLVLAALPIANGLTFVLLAFQQRIETSAAPVKAIGPPSPR